MNTRDYISALKKQLKGLADLFDDDMLSTALSTALAELGWTVPTTRKFRTYWILERAKRACVSMMCMDTAYAFKFKEINLQQRFEHFSALLKQMDEQFEAAKKANPEEFIIEDPEMTSDEKSAQFGDYYGSRVRYTKDWRFK